MRKPSDGKILVTGANGGVGSIAIIIFFKQKKTNVNNHHHHYRNIRNRHRYFVLFCFSCSYSLQFVDK